MVMDFNEGRSDMINWYPSANVDAQCSHFGWGVAFVLMGEMLGNVWAGIWTAIGWGILKEYGFDILIEHDSWYGSHVDFAFYMAGATTACVLVYYAKKADKG